MTLLRPPTLKLRRDYERVMPAKHIGYVSKSGKENASMLTLIFTERIGEAA